MESITQENLTYKGTRVLIGNEKRQLLNDMIKTLHSAGFQEISIPIIQYQNTFANKVGEENNNLMFNFKDRGNRDICLAPEYTAIIQKLASSFYKNKKDIKLFYVQECFRGEKPQAGRYRQFTQLGVEIINPTISYNDYLIQLSKELLISTVVPCRQEWYEKVYLKNLIVNTSVTRGLDYYKEGKGFEISYEELGAQKQICGGGEYEGGVGFALGVDRILLISKDE